MTLVLSILVNVILPIFILIGVGVALDRAFSLDLPTLSKLNFYVFVPALIFVRTLDARLPAETFGAVAAFTLAHLFVMFVLSWIVFGRRAFMRHRPVMTLAAIFSNAGNYGIPLATLAFGSAGASIMAIVVLVQNLATFTAGLLIMDAGRQRWRDVLAGFVRVPVIYAVAIALLLVWLKVELPRPLYDPLRYLSDGLVPVALLTLGIQLSRSRVGGRLRTLSLISAIRLIVSPLLALAMAAAWSVVAPVGIAAAAPVLVVAAGMPVAVNVYILSVEYQRDSELASQMILWTTLLSAVTLTGWLTAVGAGR